MTVEYTHAGEMWRVSRWDLMRAEFPDLAEDQLPAFHDLLESDPRRWRIVRGLYGIQPVLLPAGIRPDDWRSRSPLEVQAELGITQPQLRAELDSVRGRVAGAVAQEGRERSAGGGGQRAEGRGQRAEGSDRGSQIADRRSQGETTAADGQRLLEFTDAAVLERFGFESGMFEVPRRDSAANGRERDWFCARVRECEKMLEQTMTRELTRRLLLNELTLRRIDAEMLKSIPGGKEYSGLHRLKEETEKTYGDLIDQLDRMAPWSSVLRTKLGFVGVIADVTRAIQEYRARGDTTLVDGMHTMTEVLVLLRRSKQAPEPQYRAGLVTYVNAAKAGLWDTHWKCPYAVAQLRAIDRAWRAAAVAAMNEAGVPVADLEADGPEGEYPDLKE